jgi:glycosyltransferase involved in cell wall biosynthesis
MKVCVIIPTYNEAHTIGGLIFALRQLSFDVIVIDDGSYDDTKLVAKNSGAIVLENIKNSGKGFSLRRGFEYALKKDYDFVVTMDGDGQHSPSDIKRFIETADRENAGVIVGDRMQNCLGMPWVRKTTNRLMSSFVSKLSGQYIPDTQCGFRLIKASVLRKIELTSQRFEIETELLIKAARSGFRIISVPIKTIYQGEKSKINPFLDTIRFMRLIRDVKNERY